MAEFLRLRAVGADRDAGVIFRTISFFVHFFFSAGHPHCAVCRSNSSPWPRHSVQANATMRNKELHEEGSMTHEISQTM